MRLIRSADYHRIPWKNGGGMLGDIIASPDGAGLDSFDWRLSTAHVGHDGPFSVFPGIDRTMKIMGGAELRLQITGMDSVTLTPDSAPFDFPGDAPTEAFLGNGPIDNLNIMVRRGKFASSMRQSMIRDEFWLSPLPGHTLLMFLEKGTVGAQGTEDRQIVEPGDTLLATAPVMLHTPAPATACIIEIWPL
jgi:uncharacterized protein